MKRNWLVLALVLCFACPLVAKEPDIDVHCPAVAFDDHDDRGRSLPEGPRPVVLLVVGRGTSSAKSEFKKRDDQPSELIVEKVLFGSPPGGKIVLAPSRFGFRGGFDGESRIYELTAERARDGQVAYSANYLYDRT